MDLTDFWKDIYDKYPAAYNYMQENFYCIYTIVLEPHSDQTKERETIKHPAFRDLYEFFDSVSLHGYVMERAGYPAEKKGEREFFYNYGGMLDNIRAKTRFNYDDSKDRILDGILYKHFVNLRPEGGSHPTRHGAEMALFKKLFEGLEFILNNKRLDTWKRLNFIA